MLFLKTFVLLALLFVGMLVFNFGLHIISESNDFAVIGGLAIMFGYVALAVVAGRFVFRKIKATLGTNNFNGVFAVLAVLGTSVLTTGCGTTVKPGYVGIKVNQWGSDKGVQSYPIQTGWVGYNPFTEDVLQYPTFVQRAVWTHDANEGSPTNEEVSFNSKESLQFHGDISFSYRLLPAKVPAFYVKFRSDDLNGFTHGFLRDVARDLLNETSVHFTTDEILSTGKEAMLKELRDRLNKTLEPTGVVLEQFGFISAPRPPDSLRESIENKLKANQRALQAENELREATAQAKKTVAAAQGTAEANQRIAASITPNIVEWRRLDVQQQAISKWNGVMPQFSGGGTMPLIQIPAK